MIIFLELVRGCVILLGTGALCILLASSAGLSVIELYAYLRLLWFYLLIDQSLSSYNYLAPFLFYFYL